MVVGSISRRGRKAFISICNVVLLFKMSKKFVYSKKTSICNRQKLVVRLLFAVRTCAAAAANVAAIDSIGIAEQVAKTGNRVDKRQSLTHANEEKGVL